MARRLRVAAVGEVAVDLYLPEGERRLGGISANFARSARACGAAAALYAAVGDDDEGRFLRGVLAGAGLAPLRLRRLAGESALQRIRVAPGGERRFDGFRAGVLSRYRLEPHEAAELGGYDVVAVPASPETRGVYEQVLALAPGPRRVADFSLESPLGDAADPVAWLAPFADALDIAFVGGAPDFADALAALSTRTRAVLVLTAGAAGAWAFFRGAQAHEPTHARTLVDTTGCGDAFQAAFTVAALQGETLEVSLAAGAERAAQIAAQWGGG